MYNINFLSEIKNWKLREVIEHVKVIDNNSEEFECNILKKLKLPLSNDHSGINRKETKIDWKKMSQYYNFSFDKIGIENEVTDCLRKSELSKYDFLIMTYGWKEPVVMIPTLTFFEDWEGFIRSTLYQTIIFSKDYKLIMEISRDFFLHSNFEIFPSSGKCL